MIVNNRLSSIPGLYSRQCLRGERVENSIIDYILVRPRDWSHVLAEGVWEDSGPLFASDHNMLFVDFNLAGLLPPPPLPEGGGFFPPRFQGVVPGPQSPGQFLFLPWAQRLSRDPVLASD